MKKLLAFFSLLICSMLLLMTGCGGNSATGTETGTQTGTKDVGEQTTQIPQYDIVFSVSGKEQVVSVGAGEIPVFPGETSWEDSQHFYKITGWDSEITPADSNKTYIAEVGTYGLTVYDIRFNMPSGIIKVVTHEGEVPTPPSGYEQDYVTVEKIGHFTGWDKELTPANADTMGGKKFKVYSPVYQYETRYYEIIFSIAGTDYPLSLAAHEMPECPVSTNLPATETTIFRFMGWDKEITEVKENAKYTAQYNELPYYFAVLTNAKNGAKAIISMTFDDGIYDTAVWLNSEFEKYNLKGSSMMIVNRVLGGDTYTGTTSTINSWLTLFANGRIEPQNHSMTHAVLPTEGWANGNESSLNNNTQQKYAYELIQALEEQKKAFPDYDIICFAPSNNTLSTYSFKTDSTGTIIRDLSGKGMKVEDGGAQAVVNGLYYAVRQGSRGFQSLNPSFGSTAGCWHNLSMHGFGDAKNDITVAKGWLDTALKDGGWLVTMCHGITATGGDMMQSVADEYFAYMAQFVADGTLWSATFGEATKYIRERQNTTVSERLEGNSVFVDMVINRSTEDGLYLTESVFDEPLTVEARVPADWTSVSYTDKGVTQVAQVYTGEDGFTYAMVNLTPGENGVTVTTELTKN